MTKNCSAIIACCMLGSFFPASGMAQSEIMTNICFAPMPQVIVGATSSVAVTMMPTGSFQLVNLEISSRSGVGACMFAETQSTSMVVSTTCTVHVYGTVASTIESNLVLMASTNGTGVSSNLFTVTDTNLISFSAAKNIADQFILGDQDISIPTATPVSINLVSNYTLYVVTYENSPAPNVFTGDFLARVRIDSRSGAVTDGIEVSD